MSPRRLTVPLAIAAAGLALAACGDGDDDGKDRAQAGSAGCAKVAKPKAKSARLKAPKETLGRSEKPVAVVKTNCGSFEIALDARRSPKTASSFAHLVKRGFYDGTTFHRIVSGFVIQGGDPAGTGRGGPGYSVTEPPPDSIAYRRGVVAMAKNAVEPPGTSGSQFYVVTAADAGLPPDYAYLGKVTKGLSVVQRIGRLGDPASGEAGTPTETVVIQKMTLRSS